MKLVGEVLIIRIIAFAENSRYNHRKLCGDYICSLNTALRDILHLVTHGILIKNKSDGRSTSYDLVDKTIEKKIE